MEREREREIIKGGYTKRESERENVISLLYLEHTLINTSL